MESPSGHRVKFVRDMHDDDCESVKELLAETTFVRNMIEHKNATAFSYNLLLFMVTILQHRFCYRQCLPKVENLAFCLVLLEQLFSFSKRKVAVSSCFLLVELHRQPQCLAVAEEEQLWVEVDDPLGRCLHNRQSLIIRNEEEEISSWGCTQQVRAKPMARFRGTTVV